MGTKQSRLPVHKTSTTGSSTHGISTHGSISVPDNSQSRSSDHQSRHEEPPQHKRNEKDFCKMKRIIDEPNPNNIIEVHVSNIFKDTDNLDDFVIQIEDMRLRIPSQLESMGDTLRNTFLPMKRRNEIYKNRIINKEIYGKLKDTDTDCKKNNKEPYCDTTSKYSMNFYMEYILYLFLFVSVIVLFCQKQK